eukprot:XP_011669137.1 PREDICTED: uncharacterized protein LOC100888566 [Strongylocentrotus purpuratus]
MTEKLWSCLRSFTSLKQLSISGSSLSFPPSPPELPFVTELSAERMTSQGYEGVLSLIPGVREIDVSIDVAKTSNTLQITSTSRPMGQTRPRDEEFFVHIKLHAWPVLTTDRKIDSGESIGGLSLLFEDQTKNRQRLHVSGMKGRDEETLVDMFVKTKQLTYLNSESEGGSLNEKYAVQQLTHIELTAPDSLPPEKKCVSSETMTGLGLLIREQTKNLQWLCLSIVKGTDEEDLVELVESCKHVKTIHHLMLLGCGTNAHGRLRSRITGLNKSEKSLRVIALHQLTHIKLTAPCSLPSEKNIVSRETMRGLGHLIRKRTKCLQWLCLSRVKGTDEKDLVEFVECCKHVKTMNHVLLLGCGTNAHGRLRSRITGLNKSEKSLRVIALHDNGQLFVEKCQLSTEMTEKLWSYLRSFTSLNHLTISDSSLKKIESLSAGKLLGCGTNADGRLSLHITGLHKSEKSLRVIALHLLSVTKLSTKRVTSQSYEGLLSSLPGLRDIDITIDNAERDILQITASLRRTGGQQLTSINLTAPPDSLPSKKKSVSRETMRGLRLLIGEHTKNLQRLELSWVKCTYEEDLVDLIECCRRVKTMSVVRVSDGVDLGS